MNRGIPSFLHNKAEFHQEWRKRVGEDRLLSVEGKSFPLSVAWGMVEQALKILMVLWNFEQPEKKKKRLAKKAKLVASRRKHLRKKRKGAPIGFTGRRSRPRKKKR